MSELNNETNMLQIISALEYLKKASAKEGLEDFEDMIDACFRLCLNTYLIIKRTGILEDNDGGSARSENKMRLAH